MALTVWDRTLGATRDATQEDIDALQAASDALGRLVAAVSETAADLRVQVHTIQQRYRTSAELSGDL